MSRVLSDAMPSRSFLAESLSRFVKAALDGRADVGREPLESFRERYPIVLARSMQAARRGIRRQRRGTEQPWLVASARRLKLHTIDIRLNLAPAHWFLTSPWDAQAVRVSKTRRRNFRCRGWSSTGQSSSGTPTHTGWATIGVIAVFSGAQ